MSFLNSKYLLLHISAGRGMLYIFATLTCGRVTVLGDTKFLHRRGHIPDTAYFFLISLLIHPYCFSIFGSLRPTDLAVPEGPRQPPQADCGGGELVQVAPFSRVCLWQFKGAMQSYCSVSLGTSTHCPRLSRGSH